MILRLCGGLFWPVPFLAYAVGWRICTGVWPPHSAWDWIDAHRYVVVLGSALLMSVVVFVGTRKVA